MEATIRIDALTYGSAGIGRNDDGKAVFVDQTAPGDLAEVEIVEDKGSYQRGILRKILEPSPARTTPSCPFSSSCGGCTWQHVSFQTQAEAKRKNVVDALARIARKPASDAEALVEACISGKKDRGYRNKLEFACSTSPGAGGLHVGFHAQGSDDIIEPRLCELGCRGLAESPKALRGALRFAQGTGDLGIFRIGMRKSLRTGACEVALWTLPGPFPRKGVTDIVASAVKATSIVRVIAEPGKRRALKGVEALHGAGCWREELAGFEYLASAPSFFQVNTAQAETLVETVMDALDVSDGEAVADLYCGVGTFTLPLAERAGFAYGIEAAASSVRDLRRNAEKAGVSIEVVGGDSARELPELGHLDALVVDPPRSGLSEQAVKALSTAAPSRMAYVSCDPSTWARDAARLENEGFDLKRVVPVDLFPQTYHCELVSLFERRLGR